MASVLRPIPSKSWASATWAARYGLPYAFADFIGGDGTALTRHYLPGMRARRDGLIINVSSWAGRHVSALTGAGYNATKRAVIALSETINCEECTHGIRATSILPGEVATPLLEKRPVPPSQAERARMAQSEDLGRAILFVAAMPAKASPKLFQSPFGYRSSRVYLLRRTNSSLT